MIGNGPNKAHEEEIKIYTFIISSTKYEDPTRLATRLIQIDGLLQYFIY